MACTCTEDKEQIGNVIIGRNKVVCDECKARIVQEAKNERKRQIGTQLAEIDRVWGPRYIREHMLSLGKKGTKNSQGIDVEVAESQAAVLRAELSAL